MKKYMLTLLAALALSGINLVAANVPQPQESWYDWSKRHARNVGHYVPSWHYWPAIAAGIAATGLGNEVMYFGPGEKLFIASDPVRKDMMGQVAFYGSLPYLLAAGYVAKKWGEHYGKTMGDRTNYAYYAPGIALALLPKIIGHTQYARMMSQIGGGTKSGPWALAPLLLGAGHLAHQYFNPPVQAPVVPVSPQQLEEQMQPKNVEQPSEIEGILK